MSRGARDSPVTNTQISISCLSCTSSQSIYIDIYIYMKHCRVSTIANPPYGLSLLCVTSTRFKVG